MIFSCFWTKRSLLRFRLQVLESRNQEQ